jgi:hypothetical protein
LSAFNEKVPSCFETLKSQLSYQHGWASTPNYHLRLD